MNKKHDNPFQQRYGHGCAGDATASPDGAWPPAGYVPQTGGPGGEYAGGHPGCGETEYPAHDHCGHGCKARHHGAPGYGNAGYGNPGYGSRGYGNPGYGNPGYGNPGYGNPGYGPRYGAPGCDPAGANRDFLQGLSAYLPSHQTEQFLIGLMIGAGAAWLISDEELRGKLIKAGMKFYAGIAGGFEELKEQMADIKAEVAAEQHGDE